MKEKILQHLYSFAKTYITCFIAGLLAVANIENWLTPEIIQVVAWTSLLSVLRNFYKILTEK